MIRLIQEMAYNRSAAIRRCGDLGYQFVQHFLKIVNDENGVSSDNFHHRCSEMQTWFNQVNHIVLSYNKKPISNKCLYDWFFTYGSLPEYIIDVPHIELYKSFINEILNNRDNANIEETLTKLLSEV